MKNLSFILVMLMSSGFAVSGEASVVASHVGAVDPVTQGWSEVVAESLAEVGPVSGDRGLEAWNVTNTTANSFQLYRQRFAAPDQIDFDEAGWVLRATLRIAEAPETPNGGIWLENSSLAKRFILSLGQQADGDPVVQLPTVSDRGVIAGDTVVLEGFGDGYHEYTLAFDPASGTADLIVDGTLIVEDYAGAAGNLSSVLWGAGIHRAAANANYHKVELTILPEPAAGVWAAGLALLLRGRGDARNSERSAKRCLRHV